MRQLTLKNTTRSTILGTRVALADTFMSRLRGLNHQVLEAGEGLLLIPCHGVHTFGMETPLDLIFLDRRGTVVGLRERVPPQRVSPGKFGTASVLELPPGTIRSSHTQEGDRLSWSGTPEYGPALEPAEGCDDHCR